MLSIMIDLGTRVFFGKYDFILYIKVLLNKSKPIIIFYAETLLKMKE